MNIRYVMILLLALMGCSDETKVVQTLPDTEESNSLLAGIWQHQEGDVFSDIKFIRFDAQGRGTFYGEDPDTGILECTKVLYAVLSDSAVAVETGKGSMIFSFSTENNSMTLMGGEEISHSFVSVDAVPDSAKCKEFSQVDIDEDIDIRISSFTGLAYDGNQLWFGTGSNLPYEIVSYNPVDGQLGTPLEYNLYRHIHAADGENFWGHCGCGGSPEAALYDKSVTELDIVDTDVDLGNDISIRNMAWDGTYLWLNGYNYGTGNYEFLKIDSDAEPDVLIEVFTFGSRLNGLTWDGSHFWAIDGDQIVKIDPTTFKAVETYSNPNALFYWQAIEFVGPELYLLGKSENTGKPAIAKLTL